MAQDTLPFGLPEAGPKTPVAYSQKGNETFNAFLSGHYFTARPSYAVRGTIWFKDTASSPLLIEQYFFDGTDDILMATFNVATNTYTPVVVGLASLTEAQTFTKTQTWTKGADVASAASLVLLDGNSFDVTGAVTVTAIGTKAIGTVVKLHFDGAPILTHHATNLILPGGLNILAAAGDEAEFLEYSTGLWRCESYQRASDKPSAWSSMPIGGVKVATYTVVRADKGKLFIMNAAGATDFDLPAFSTVENGDLFAFRNIGAGTCTIDGNAAEEIDGATTVDLATDEVRVIAADTANSQWRTVAVVTVAAASGGYTTVEVQSASASSDITFTHTIEVGYDYQIRARDIKLSVDATGANAPRVQVGTGGGPTFQTSGYVSQSIAAESTTLFSSRTDTTAGLPFTGQKTLGGAGAGETWSGVIEIFDPGANAETDAQSRVGGMDSSSLQALWFTTSRRETAEVVTGLRVLPGTGTITTGEFILERKKVTV